MTAEEEIAIRLSSLVNIVGKELQYLQQTDGRLFSIEFTVERASTMSADPDLSERVEAFVSRFGRLQDTLGDKLLPLYLRLIGERPRGFLDNLDRAEQLALVDDAAQWSVMRKLRNQMVHEYIDDLVLFASAINQAHVFIPVMARVTALLSADIMKRVGA